MAERNIVGIVDAGGRGAALARAYEKSPHVDGIVVIPGNDMIEHMAKKPTEVFPNINITDTYGIGSKFKELGVTLVDVAQDEAIRAQVADETRFLGIPTIGPSREAGRIEWSKSYARSLGRQISLQQPDFAVFKNIDDARNYLDVRDDRGYAVKADGLAAGKGVKITSNREETIQAILDLKAQFPLAADTFLLESLAQGEEFSTFFASDGESTKILRHARDHKREGDNDTGENTGGMGCVAPPRFMTEGIELQVANEIDSMMYQLKQNGTPYEGVGFYGGMWDAVLKRVNNIEFNARWGDPEAQVVIPGITSDMFELAMSIVDKNLKKYDLKTDNLVRVVVVGASRGYPRNYDGVKGKRIFGLDEVMKMKGVELYGAGVRVDEDGNYYANGGRLFSITGVGKDAIKARERALGAMARVHIDGNDLIYRHDIGWRDVQRLREAGY